MLFFYNFTIPVEQYNWNIVESGIKHHNPNPISIPVDVDNLK
jgi:hypothetical protein